jgi:hypothetical protein
VGVAARAVVGLALRFALRAAQGCAPAQANDKENNRNEERKMGHFKRGKKGDILKEP